jgi:hypothetical protein
MAPNPVTVRAFLPESAASSRASEVNLSDIQSPLRVAPARKLAATDRK